MGVEGDHSKKDKRDTQPSYKASLVVAGPASGQDEASRRKQSLAVADISGLSKRRRSAPMPT